MLGASERLSTEAAEQTRHGEIDLAVSAVCAVCGGGAVVESIETACCAPVFAAEHG